MKIRMMSNRSCQIQTMMMLFLKEFTSRKVLIRSITRVWSKYRNKSSSQSFSKKLSKTVSPAKFTQF